MEYRPGGRTRIRRLVSAMLLCVLLLHVMPHPAGAVTIDSSVPSLTSAASESKTAAVSNSGTTALTSGMASLTSAADTTVLSSDTTDLPSASTVPAASEDTASTSTLATDSIDTTAQSSESTVLPTPTDTDAAKTETGTETGEPTESESEESEPEEGEPPEMSLMMRQAETKLVGRPTGSFLKVRNKPTTISSLTVHTLMLGEKVEVLEEVSSEDDPDYPTWYKVAYTISGETKEGYVASQFLVVTEETEEEEGMSDEEFEAHLTAEGFPESYKPALRSLHKKYPLWTFRSFFPQRQGGGTVTWAEALNQQARVGVNMVPRTDASRFKSYDPKTYNYRNDSWYHLDSGWTGASAEAVGYYLDPRNFLDEQSVFMFESLAYDPEFHDLAGVRQALSGSFMGNMTRYNGIDETGASVSLDHAEMFMRAAEYSRANPIFLAQRSIYEVSPGGSGSVSGSYKSSKYPSLDFSGIFNYYNIGAYNDASDPVGNGLHYALTGTNSTFLLPWNSRYKAIVGGARWISDGYILANQHTSYLQKFDLDFDGRYGAFWHQYMGNLRAPQGEAHRVYNTYAGRGELDRAFVFVIPVMANMPGGRAPYPSDDRSRNNYLETLTVQHGTMTPAFNPEIYSYSVTLPDHATTTVVNAKAYHSTANVTRIGVYEVPVGSTTISVDVESQRGDHRVYQLTLIRTGTAPPPTTTTTAAPTAPALKVETSVLHLDGDRLMGFDLQAGNNLAEKLSDLLAVTDGYRMEVKDASGSVITSGRLGTGSTVAFFAPGQSAPTRTLTVLIFGDANGDGQLNSVDMTLMFEYRMGRHEADELFVKAMDTNRDGQVNSVDMTDVFENRMGRKTIKQK